MTKPKKFTRTVDFGDIPEASADQLDALRRFAMRRGTPSPSESIPAEPSELDSREGHPAWAGKREAGPYHACAAGVR